MKENKINKILKDILEAEDNYDLLNRRPLCKPLIKNPRIMDAVTILYSKKGQGSDGEWLVTPRDVEKLLAERFLIFMKDGGDYRGKYNPIPSNTLPDMTNPESNEGKLEKWHSKFPAGQGVLNRMLELYDCDRCGIEHYAASAFSRQAIKELRDRAAEKAEKDIANPLEPVRWEDGRSFEERGISREIKKQLKRMHDEVNREVKKGSYSPYDDFNYADLVHLQFVEEYYSDVIASTYDKLVIADELSFAWREKNGDYQKLLDWLQFSPWVGQSQIDDYEAALKLENVSRAPTMLRNQFVRPDDCMPYSLPTQIIQEFIRSKDQSPNRNINVVGIEPFDSYEISGSADTISKNFTVSHWKVVHQYDRLKSWEVASVKE